jgi:hypothetical protein
MNERVYIYSASCEKFSFALSIVEGIKSSAGKNSTNTCKKDIGHLSTIRLDVADKYKCSGPVILLRQQYSRRFVT